MAEDVECAACFVVFGFAEPLREGAAGEAAEGRVEACDALVCSSLERPPVEMRFFLEDEAMLLVSIASKSAYDCWICWKAAWAALRLEVVRSGALVGDGDWRFGGGCVREGTRTTSSAMEGGEDDEEEGVDARDVLFDFGTSCVLMVLILDSAILAARRCGTN